MMKNGTNGISRIVPAGLAILLLIGVIGSVVMGSRARSAATAAAVDQASEITDSSLPLVFRPDDIDAPASDLRAEGLSSQLRTVVIDPSDFNSVALWSPDGQILYSTERGRIGNQLDGERDRIREALRGEPQTSTTDGELSIMLPLEFESGVGEPAVVELIRSDEPIAAATTPWRTNAIFISIALVIVVGLLLWNLLSPAATTESRHPVMIRAEQRAQASRGEMPRGEMSRGPVQPIAQITAPRPISVPQPGVKEEGDARRMAEDRARAAEERVGVLQEQYRKTLEELQIAHRQAQQATSRPDPRLEDRAMQAESRARQLEEHARTAEERARTLEERSRELEDRARLFERQAQTLQAEQEEMARHLIERAQEGELTDADTRAQQAEQETIGLRAELEGVQTQLSLARRELEGLKTDAERARALQGDLDAIQVETLRAQETSDAAQQELSTKTKELEDLRNEVRALRTEEQRAAMLADELRATKTELQSVTASHRADLFEREAELEEKVRSMREDFQTELARMETQHREQLALQEVQLSQRVSGAEDAAQQRFDAAERELAQRAERFEHAEDEIAKATAKAQHLSGELDVARAELDTTVAQLLAETERTRELGERTNELERIASESTSRADRLATELETAAQGNTDLNRRLQEVEARRQLEIADAEGRTDLDDILRVTQERLAGQTEKLIAAEERSHDLERQVAASAERLEQVEAELRQQQMAQAMREIRGETTDHPVAREDGAGLEDALPIEDRRATSPFMQELSMDARKSLTRIMGITQILKHKKDGKEQAQLIRQLTAHTRRLEHVVTDLGDSERLAHGTVELTVRRTDLEPIIQRVVEESGLDADHELRVHAERLVVAIDPLRTEQIIAGLLRASGDRTPPKKAIAIRLEAIDGGALIAVEDPEPSSDASLSPVVKRFAEVQGGWARVESRETGGSSFKVFLPDGAGIDAPAGAMGREVKVVVDEPSETWEPHDEKALVDELHRLSTAED
jgi:hypothetical protein